MREKKTKSGKDEILIWIWPLFGSVSPDVNPVSYGEILIQTVLGADSFGPSDQYAVVYLFYITDPALSSCKKNHSQ